MNHRSLMVSYVRDETVVSYTGDGAVSYQIPDGGKAAVGDAIAQIYADETAIETHQQIEELEKKLAVLERIFKCWYIRTGTARNIVAAVYGIL